MMTIFHREIPRQVSPAFLSAKSEVNRISIPGIRHPQHLNRSFSGMAFVHNTRLASDKHIYLTDLLVVASFSRGVVTI